MLTWLRPKKTIDDNELQSAMRMLLVDGSLGQTMLVLTTGAFLIGYALELGASNKIIGLFAAIGPLSQTLQVPAVYLVERTRRRKLLVIVTILVSRAVWLFIAVLPWFVPIAYVIPIFLAALFIHYGLGAVGGCAFNSWVRDLIPERGMAMFFARRLTLATAIGAALGLAGGVAVDLGKTHLGSALVVYSVLFAVAGVAGLVGIYFLGRTAEPQMPQENGESIWSALRQPLHDVNFRALLIFLAWWSFAVNFAAPFFAVYLLSRLGLDMSWVLVLAVISQLFNVFFFKVWGSLADRFSNKSVIVLSGTVFIMTFLMWPFTTMPEKHQFTLPILIVIHVLTGISTAGVNLCAGNLALKTAPYGKAGSYLAMNALISGIVASVAPIVAGFAADWFATEQVTLTLRLASSIERHPAVQIPALDIRGLDFLFLIAFVFGLYSIHRLLAVREEGEVRESVVRQAFLAEMGRLARQVSTAAGVRQILVMPYMMVRGFSRHHVSKPDDQSRATLEAK